MKISKFFVQLFTEHFLYNRSLDIKSKVSILFKIGNDFEQLSEHIVDSKRRWNELNRTRRPRAVLVCFHILNYIVRLGLCGALFYYEWGKKEELHNFFKMLLEKVQRPVCKLNVTFIRFDYQHKRRRDYLVLIVCKNQHDIHDSNSTSEHDHLSGKVCYKSESNQPPQIRIQVLERKQLPKNIVRQFLGKSTYRLLRKVPHRRIGA